MEEESWAGRWKQQGLSRKDGWSEERWKHKDMEDNGIQDAEIFS